MMTKTRKRRPYITCTVSLFLMCISCYDPDLSSKTPTENQEPHPLRQPLQEAAATYEYGQPYPGTYEPDSRYRYINIGNYWYSMPHGLRVEPPIDWPMPDTSSGF